MCPASLSTGYVRKMYTGFQKSEWLWSKQVMRELLKDVNAFILYFYQLLVSWKSSQCDPYPPQRDLTKHWEESTRMLTLTNRWLNMMFYLWIWHNVLQMLFTIHHLFSDGMKICLITYDLQPKTQQHDNFNLRIPEWGIRGKWPPSDLQDIHWWRNPLCLNGLRAAKFNTPHLKLLEFVAYRIYNI